MSSHGRFTLLWRGWLIALPLIVWLTWRVAEREGASTGIAFGVLALLLVGANRAYYGLALAVARTRCENCGRPSSGQRLCARCR